MTREEFEKLVEQGIRAIPKNFMDKLSNVDIIIEDEPTKEQLQKLKIRKDSLLFGLYEGVPQTKRWGYSQVLPDKITIFKKPIEEFANSPEEINKFDSAASAAKIILFKFFIYHYYG